jgi:curved DNA-binding protein CbpA
MNFYEYLGVKNNATDVEIRKAFRSLAKQKHPDHNKKESAFWDMVELNIVRDTLLNPAKRIEYDRSLQNGATGEYTPTHATPEPARKRGAIYRSVKSLFTYHCRVCGIEMSSTWRGYCLLHYLEASGQIDNPEFIFEYGGQKYKWADPPSHIRAKNEEKNSHATSSIKVKPIQILIYTIFIIIISVYIMMLGSQLLR